MSTTVSYKGNTLTTVSNNTKTLETEGKYLEADIILTDVSQAAPVLETVTKSYTPTESQQTESITPGVGYDGIGEVDVTVSAVPMAVQSYLGVSSGYTTQNGQRKWRFSATQTYTDAGYVNSGTTNSDYYYRNAIATGTSVTPTESSQTIGGADVMMEGAVTVNAIPSNYVGSGVTQRDSTDLSASGATVTAPAGYYESQATKSVSSGSATPAASISATGATASSNGTTITLSKTVSNTPQVSAGYVSSGTAGNSSVSLSATDSNFTAENIKSGVSLFGKTGSYTGGGGTLTVATKTLTNTAVAQTLSFTSLSGQPKYWFLRVTSNVSSSGSTTYYYITDLFYNGTNITGNTFRIGSTRRVQNVTSGISQSYSSGTLTITAGSSSGATPGQFYGASGIGYELVYIY